MEKRKKKRNKIKKLGLNLETEIFPDKNLRSIRQTLQTGTFGDAIRYFKGFDPLSQKIYQSLRAFSLTPITIADLINLEG